MILALFALVYLAGAAAIAFWIDARFPRLAPSEIMPAMVHLFAAALANSLLDERLALAAASLPHGRLLAVLGVVLPLVVYVALAAIWVLKIAHRALSGYMR